MALCGLTLAGCKSQQETNLPICKAEVAGSEADEVASGAVPADIWFLIMLRNFDRNTMQVRRPVQDCSGRAVQPPPESANACVLGDDPPAALPERPLTEDDLLIAPTEDGRQIVWVKTGEYENGEAVGPVGLTEWTSKGVAVRAIGTLRAQADRAAIRLEPMGKDQVLVVESRRCDPDDPKSCARMVRLLPLEGDMFRDKPLVAADGSCLGAAEVVLFEEQSVTMGNGIERSFEVARSVDFDEGAVVINEQVTIKDKDPTQPDLPAKLFRRANVERALSLAEQGLSTEGGLWEQMIAEHGSVVVKPDAEPGAEPGEGRDEPVAEAG